MDISAPDILAPVRCSVATLFRFVARFARGRIEDSSFNRFALNGIQRDFFGAIFSGGILVGGILSGYPQRSRSALRTKFYHE